MQKIFALSIAVTLFSYFTNEVAAQSAAGQKDSVKKYVGVTDSLGYMTELAAHKSKYINQPFSVLLNDLKIPVQSFSQHHDRMRCLGLILYFDDAYNTTQEKWNNWDRDAVCVIIEWQKPMLRSDIETYVNKGAGEWNKSAQNYFKDEIVSDIVVPFRKSM